METPSEKEFINTFKGLPEDLFPKLIIAADHARVNRVAIVGGILRDLLITKTLQQTIKEFQDLDLIIEGSVEKFSEAIEQTFEKDRVSIIRRNSSYKTIELTIDEIRIDIARARIDNYEKPGENPKIEKTSIEEDLFRRDFTINSIALDIRNNKIIDPYKGIQAITNRKLELIHKKSISEDPTRIIRAARYSSRLNFELNSSSILQIQFFLKQWPWGWSYNESPESAPPALSTRLRMELDLLFEKENYKKCIKNLQEWGALILLDKEIQYNNNLQRSLHWAFRLGVNPLTTLIAGASNPLSLAKRLNINQSEIFILEETSKINEYFSDIYFLEESKNYSPAQWCEKIESLNFNPEAIAIIICLRTAIWKSLLRWWSKWRFIKSKQTAKDLLKNGWEQGPKLGDELKRLRNIELKKLDAQIEYFEDSK